MSPPSEDLAPKSIIGARSAPQRRNAASLVGGDEKEVAHQGGLGRYARRTALGAYWSSCLVMIHQRLPRVEDGTIDTLEGAVAARGVPQSAS